MTDDAAIPAALPSGVRALTGTERMRRHRERRLKRMRCLMIELREAEIDVFIRRGQLNPDHRANAHAVRQALYGFFDQYLV
jgi:hypothetical protein